MDTCENCSRVIGKMETPRLLLGKVVCIECDDRLRQQIARSHPPVALSSGPAPASSNRILVGILALFFGGLGIHRFVLGQVIGILYLLFCWTFIPSIIALIEAILFFSMSDAEFIARYQTPPAFVPRSLPPTPLPPPPAVLPRATPIPTMPSAAQKADQKSFRLS